LEILGLRPKTWHLLFTIADSFAPRQENQTDFSTFSATNADCEPNSATFLSSIRMTCCGRDMGSGIFIVYWFPTNGGFRIFKQTEDE
jgi:hypothetical protein